MRIGLIAMSGLRLCKAELLELGLSFPGVARRARQIEALPSLGLLTLAGMTPDHIDIEYMEVADVDSDDLPLRFDAVAISTLSATSKEAYRLSGRFREHGILAILGGLHVTLQPHDAVRYADAVVIGEGEVVWPQILRDLERRQLQPFYDAKQQGPFDLAQAPMPRFDLLAPDRYPRFGVQTQRGCPWSCEFCASSIRLSPRFKVKPVDRVVAEIRELKRLFPNPFIEFADDNTFVNRKHARQLMAALEPEGVRWFTETDISVGDDPELLRMMRDAGCVQVLIGLESPAATVLDGVETNSNWKVKRLGRYMNSIEQIQRHGITVNGCFIMGMDRTGRESFSDVARFVRDSGLFDVQITYLTPFPGTPLFERLRAEGRLLDGDASERCTLFDVNFRPDQMTVSELEEGFERLAAVVYNPRAVVERTSRFKSHLRSRVMADGKMSERLGTTQRERPRRRIGLGGEAGVA